MDGTRFDTIARQLTTASSRRRIVGGLLGSAAILTGATVVDAKKGKGKKKGHGKGKGKAKGKTKVFICHKGQVLHVASPALKGHLGHGDTECGEAPVCHTGDPTSCDKETGVCTFALAEEGSDCTTEDGATGTCSAEGECVVPCVGEGEPCGLDDDCCEGLTCNEQSACEAV